MEQGIGIILWDGGILSVPVFQNPHEFAEAHVSAGVLVSILRAELKCSFITYTYNPGNVATALILFFLGDPEPNI